MHASPLSLAYTSSTASSASLPMTFPHGFPAVSKPFRPSPSSAPASLAHEPDPSHQVIAAEETVPRGSLEETHASALALLFAGREARGLEPHVRYVHECLDRVRAARERGEAEGGAGMGGPQEELAYAIQSLQTALREREQHKGGTQQRPRQVSAHLTPSTPMSPPLSLYRSHLPSTHR